MLGGIRAWWQARRRRTKILLVGLGLMLLLLIASPTPQPTRQTARIPGTDATPAPAALSPVPAASPTATPAPTPAPTPTPFSFGSGTKIVGTDVQPGVYRTREARTGCYWARVRGFSGGLSDIIANNLTNDLDVVEIVAGDSGFDSRGCAQWTADLSPVTRSATEPFGAGTYIVGTDISAGTWRSPGGSTCYWQRMSNFRGGLDGLIANDLGSTTPVVTIAPTDKGFRSQGCGTWTKIG